MGQTPVVSAEIVTAIRLFVDDEVVEESLSFVTGPLPKGDHVIHPIGFTDHKIEPERFRRAEAAHMEVVLFVTDVFGEEHSVHKYFSKRGAPPYSFGTDNMVPMPNTEGRIQSMAALRRNKAEQAQI